MTFCDVFQKKNSFWLLSKEACGFENANKLILLDIIKTRMACQKNGFHTGSMIWDTYFGPSVVGIHNFNNSFGWVPLLLQQALSPQFSPKSSHFSQIKPFLTQLFSVLVLFTILVVVLYASDCFSEPSYWFSRPADHSWHPKDRVVYQDVVVSGDSCHQNWVPSVNLCFSLLITLHDYSPLPFSSTVIMWNLLSSTELCLLSVSNQALEE